MTTLVSGIFIAALAFVWFSALMAAIFLREPAKLKREEPADDVAVASQRGIAAQASLRGIVFDASQARSRARAG